MPQCQFLFSAVFVFQKSCTGNILGIGRNKSRSSYFTVTKTEPEGETEKSHEVATPPLGACPPLDAPRHGVGPSGAHLPRPSAYKLHSDAKTLNQSASIHEKFRRGRHRRKQVSGDRSLCSGTLPGRGIAPGAISIDSTAIFIAVADSHDEEGVVLPRG